MPFSQKLVSVEEMIAIEKAANASGLTYEKMMANAGRGLADVIQDRFGFLDEEGALGLIGSGNNGGDTLVALAHLAEEGWKADAYIVKAREKDDPLVERLVEAGGSVVQFADDRNFAQLDRLLDEAGLLLDGVFGTGIKLPLRGDAAKTLLHVKEKIEMGGNPLLVVAVDCPSGINCASGEVAPQAIPADLTVTMAAIKRGLVSFPAFNYVGEIQLVGIGLDDDLESYQSIQRFVVDAETVFDLLPERPLDAHKGTFGTALVVGGSLNYTGAVYLAGRAAYLSGAGLVTLGVPAPLHLALAGSLPEATWLILPHEMGVVAKTAAPLVSKYLERASALLIGPGFGTEETSREFIGALLERPGVGADRRSIGFVHTEEKSEDNGEIAAMPPMIVDADGLKLLSQIPEWDQKLPGPAVLTPHPGEMAVISGLDTADIQADRIGVAEKYAREWGHVLVLKGAFTIIAAPDGRTALIPVATPALARAGTGDVLAGLIVGLRAQGVEAFEAAAAAAWIHAQAGLLAEEIIGSSTSVVAGDVLEAVPYVIENLI
jgi:NAD(P)H-hydrate epimerase